MNKQNVEKNKYAIACFFPKSETELRCARQLAGQWIKFFKTPCLPLKSITARFVPSRRHDRKDPDS